MSHLLYQRVHLSAYIHYLVKIRILQEFCVVKDLMTKNACLAHSSVWDRLVFGHEFILKIEVNLN